ncbi:class F sortase [Asanoa sp. WMMD1127]|uniref:class F sortase n=1 Tax=Asanoa sp. WMMD1127 TaxID=3016107 RepID=UPI002415CF28|nr:class F sortase [Asanoa sp. WMMD1127]MDG4826308.1 class F sortase [Asanoa sp. WMMD1127]
MAPLPEASTARAGGRRGIPWRAAGVVLVALVALAGVALLGASFKQTPTPPAPVAEAEPSFAPPTGGTVKAKTKVKQLARSAPVSISIKKIGLKAKIMKLGLRADGTLAVPPLDKPELAGWYSGGPSPGELGNAVVVGHVTTAKTGAAVFFQLGALRKKDVITIARKDGSTAKFTVDGVKSYPKKSFPTTLVYGPSAKPSLRLVTCGGVFDNKAHTYKDNVIVFATAA